MLSYCGILSDPVLHGVVVLPFFIIDNTNPNVTYNM
jgi:hypothetical protein